MRCFINEFQKNTGLVTIFLSHFGRVNALSHTKVIRWRNLLFEELLFEISIDMGKVGNVMQML